MITNRFLVYYLISGTDDPHPQKLPFATKTRCLGNFLVRWPNARIIFCADNISQSIRNELEARIQHTDHTIWDINGGSHSASFMAVLDHINSHSLPDSKPILIQEDDYFYLQEAEEKMLDALEYGDYVTGYLHPDKFMHPNDGGNPSTPETNVSEITRVVKAPSHFWMLTNSTTGTFATHAGTLRDDYDIWKRHAVGRPMLQDYQAFLDLRKKGRTVLMPIPTIATHVMTRWLAPLIGTHYTSWVDDRPDYDY